MTQCALWTLLNVSYLGDFFFGLVSQVLFCIARSWAGGPEPAASRRKLSPMSTYPHTHKKKKKKKKKQIFPWPVKEAMGTNICSYAGY
jgi:hypothetical protein